MSAKLAFVATTLIVAVASTLATAQDQTPSASTAPAPTPAQTAHVMPIGPGTDMAPFCSGLTASTRYYPDRARLHHVEGRAILECALNQSDHLETCWVVSETPTNEEFGPAAMRLACFARERPRQQSWQTFHVDGDPRVHVQIPMSFRLNERVLRAHEHPE